MNFGEFIDNCTQEEFEQLETAVYNRRRELNRIAATGLNITQSEKKLVDNNSSVKAILSIRKRTAIAKTIADEYRKYS
jgi:hypothetical protein